MTQLEIELELCKENFEFFTGYCYQNMFKKRFWFYPFHKKLVSILTNLHTLKSPRVIINAPPRIGKTEIVKHYLAWCFLKDPSASVTYISYEQNLVSRKNREIKEILLWLSTRFNIPELRMSPSADGKTEWVNRANGTILARGSRNGITGSGCSTMMVIDDPNKPEDRISAKLLERRNKVFISTIRNRINTPETPIVIIQQRIASQDLSGFLLAGGINEKWTHYNFPAINLDGTALCPERLPLDEIETYKSDPFTYNAQYLQKPLDEVGNLFDRNKLILAVARPPANTMKMVIAVDAASKGDVANDFNAIAVIGMTKTDFYVLDIINFHADITVLLKRVREMRIKWGQAIPILFESRSNGTAAAQILRKETSGILESNPCKDKIERAIVVKYLFDSMCVQFAVRGMIWGEVLSQFTQFPHVLHDDIVDAVVLGITWLNNLPKCNTSNTAQVSTQLRRPSYGGKYGSSGYNPARRF